MASEGFRRRSQWIWVLVAMELHLETLRELDRPIPEPGGRKLSERFFETWAESPKDQAELSRRAASIFTELLEQQRQVFRELSRGSEESVERRSQG